MKPNIEDFKLKPEVETTENIVGYTWAANRSLPPSEIDVDSPKCYAKKISMKNINSEKVYYYVRTGTDGRLYDPEGLYTTGNAHEYSKEKGRSVYEFKLVSKEVFTHYLKFLQTKNKAWLDTCNRLMS